MILARNSIFIILAIMLFSCNDEPYEGYRTIHEGLWYKLLEVGDDTIKVKPGDFVTVDISYRTHYDSVFFEGRRKFQIEKLIPSSSIDECCTLMSTNDRIDFIIDAGTFFEKNLQVSLPAYIDTGEIMKIDIKVVNIQSETEYRYHKEAFLKWITDFGEYEKAILEQFLSKEKLNIEPNEKGYYYIQLAKGKGMRVKKGDILVIEFEGKFLNGKFFDSTLKRKESFTFVYGDEMQVIAGLEDAIGQMHLGEKALVILPSEWAFGKSGSTTGIIPPYTSLIYEVEVKSILNK